MEAHTHRLLNQGLMLLLALAALALSFELLLFGAISLIEAFPRHPLLYSLILLSLCFSFFLCFLGSNPDYS
jgi:membrane-bound acyltransferase YfiQ involved in biofilm formation